ncbi:DUF1313 domain-containing protein [Cymbomonas tetramitiformis]|uniref:DUF1313 domain-containing protein n=1 Tax=Cymbomonas tetramitiformis TaxID=36881 RepID=A0AAE0C2E7_9CHLO|nr:DUF1313 domain-containing protein [Cymbomonas tetramitiformis]
MENGVLGSTAAQVWQSSCDSVHAVQVILDRNKLLVNEINANHDSRSPEDLKRNVVLIRELNTNINKVVELYKDLSSVFLNTVAKPQPYPTGAAS